MVRRVVSFLSALILTTFASAASPAAKNVDITAPDGTKLKATYFSARKPGPAVLLLHMCNSQRQAWEPVATQLSAIGIHALTLDYRGFGESGGDRFKDDRQKQQKLQTEKWPGDIDAALQFLESQQGVDRTRIGAGGGSCGVNNAIQLARRHPEVKSLALLAGGTDVDGLTFLYNSSWLPLFASASKDDEFDHDAQGSMNYLLALSGNPKNKFVGYDTGGHGTAMFAPHPELPKQIVDWYRETLVNAPAAPKTNVAVNKNPQREFWELLNVPDGPERAVALLREQRQNNPDLRLAPEAVVNILGYRHLQAGENKQAIEVLKINSEAYPESANVYDSLGDAYLADGQNELAIQASEQALARLANDRSDPETKAAIKKSAEDKLAKLKPSGANQ